MLSPLPRTKTMLSSDAWSCFKIYDPLRQRMTGSIPSLEISKIYWLLENHAGWYGHVSPRIAINWRNHKSRVTSLFTSFFMKPAKNGLQRQRQPERAGIPIYPICCHKGPPRTVLTDFMGCVETVGNPGFQCARLRECLYYRSVPRLDRRWMYWALSDWSAGSCWLRLEKVAPAP